MCAISSRPSISAAASSAGIGMRAGHHDAPHAGHLRRNRRHQQRRNQRKAPAGNVAADGVERRHALAHAHPGSTVDAPRPRQLLFGHAADIARGVLQRRAQFARNRARAFAPLARAHPQRFRRKPNVVQPPRPAKQRRIAAPAHVAHDAANSRLRRGRCGDAAPPASSPPARDVSRRMRITARSCSADIPRCPAPAPPSAWESGAAPRPRPRWC